MKVLTLGTTTSLMECCCCCQSLECSSLNWGTALTERSTEKREARPSLPERDSQSSWIKRTDVERNWGCRNWLSLLDEVSWRGEPLVSELDATVILTIRRDLPSGARFIMRPTAAAVEHDPAACFKRLMSKTNTQTSSTNNLSVSLSPTCLS